MEGVITDSNEVITATEGVITDSNGLITAMD